MSKLDAATGADVDRMSLENMVPHRAGAVSFAYRALYNISDPELRAVAEPTIVKQTRETNEMLAMVGK